MNFLNPEMTIQGQYDPYFCMRFFLCPKMPHSNDNGPFWYAEGMYHILFEGVVHKYKNYIDAKLFIELKGIQNYEPSISPDRAR